MRNLRNALLATTVAAALLCVQAQQASALLGLPPGGAAPGGGGVGGGPAIGIIGVATALVLYDLGQKLSGKKPWKQMRETQWMCRDGSCYRGQ